MELEIIGEDVYQEYIKKKNIFSRLFGEKEGAPSFGSIKASVKKSGRKKTKTANRKKSRKKG